MIRDLRKKFILVAMLSTMLVLTAIMGVVNFSNYREMLDRADEMTALLEQNDGKFRRSRHGMSRTTQRLHRRNQRMMKKTRVVFLWRHHLRRAILL